MTEAQSDLKFALEMYGQASVNYANRAGDDTYESMVFWQNQVWFCAQNVAKEQQ